MKKRVYKKGNFSKAKRFKEIPKSFIKKFITVKNLSLSVFILILILGLIFYFYSLNQIHNTVNSINAQLKKPAIYLYPAKPTQVNIVLDKAIRIETDIPKYALSKGWNVLAYPNGQIKDLQPQYTKCNKIDSNKFGLEYANNACKNNNYPYIYWDGKQTIKPIPKKEQGWMVKKEDLNKFLSEKLDYVGFNKAEKQEFLEYWVTKLSKINSKQYFIYFLQNKEVDNYLPMNVNPQPDSSNRFYIIAKPLNTSSNKTPRPQQLQKMIRKGFTLVDWGGSVLL